MAQPDSVLDSYQQDNAVPLSIAQCPVCSQIRDIERSYAKWGWDEKSVPLVPAVRDLVQRTPVAGSADACPAVVSLFQCPRCGTAYRYSCSSEYLVNGSEEHVELRRLAPAQARRWLSEAEYERMMQWMGYWLTDPDARVRRHAARSLAAHHSALGDTAIVGELLSRPDREIVRGALLLLRDIQRDREWNVDLDPVSQALASLQESPDEEISGAARFLASSASVEQGHGPPPA